jgi:hypothetical protein
MFNSVEKNMEASFFFYFYFYFLWIIKQFLLLYKLALGLVHLSISHKYF